MVAGVDLLGAHVLQGPDALRVGRVRGGEHLGDAEVGHLHGAAVGQHHVLGLEVPVHDGGLLGVRRGEPLGDGHRDAHRLRPGQPPALDELLAQGAPVEELERHHELPVDLARGQAAHDVGVLELREDLHFVEEQAPALLAPRQLGPEHLERHPALREPLLGLVDLAHPTFADHPPDDVLTDAFELSMACPRSRTNERATTGSERTTRARIPALHGRGEHVLHAQGQRRGDLVVAEEPYLGDLQRDSPAASSAASTSHSTTTVTP